MSVSRKNRTRDAGKAARSTPSMEATTPQLPIDDPAGLAWWNGLTSKQRAEAVDRATHILGRQATAADAWQTQPGERFDPRNDQGDVMLGADRARGVDVQLGQAVLGAESKGHVVAMGEHCCTYEDDKGERHTEAWASIHVQARGPATDAAAPDQADPFYRLAVEVSRLSQKISDTYDAEGFEMPDAISEEVFGSINTIIDELYTVSREVMGERKPRESPAEPFAPVAATDTTDLLKALDKAERTVDRLKRDITLMHLPAVRRRDEAKGGQRQ